MADTLKEFELEQKVDPAPGKPEEPVKEPEQPAPEGEKDVVEEPKKEDRSDKNYEKELRRKDEEVLRVKEENELLRSQVSQTPTPVQTDAWAQVQAMADNEMATTGRTLPLETLARMFTSITQKQLNQTVGTRENSERTIRSFKRSVHKAPDFALIEDDLDDLIDRLKPNQITPETLEVCLNSVRGKKLPELLKQAEERGRRTVERDAEIVGPAEGGTVTTTTESVNLTTAQRVEFEEYNRDNSAPYTEKEWKKELINKQSRFKVAGAKNIPQLMSDVMIK